MPVLALTILFTDIVDSTELFAAVGERSAERVLREHFDTLGEQVAHRGGREVKRLGDGVMATFPAAGLAIDAAVGMQSAVGNRPGGWDATSPPVAMRIGISSGDTFVRDGDCCGAAVVEASRLCARAVAGQSLIAESTRMLARGRTPLVEIGDVQLHGLPDPTRVWELPGSPAPVPPLRAVLADDASLVREGVARVLHGCGIEVVAQAGDAEELLTLTADLHPDIAIVDLRMPPSHTTEGIDAAEQILSSFALTRVLLLSQDLEPRYAQRLLDASTTGVGYLLKERVTDIRAFERAVRRVAAGGQAFDPALVRGGNPIDHLDHPEVPRCPAP